jgi:hypothetical protein
MAQEVTNLLIFIFLTTIVFAALLALTTAKMLWLVNISSEALAALYVIGLLLIYRLKW